MSAYHLNQLPLQNGGILQSEQAQTPYLEQTPYPGSQYEQQQQQQQQPHAQQGYYPTCQSSTRVTHGTSSWMINAQQPSQPQQPFQQHQVPKTFIQAHGHQQPQSYQQLTSSQQYQPPDLQPQSLQQFQQPQQQQQPFPTIAAPQQWAQHGSGLSQSVLISPPNVSRPMTNGHNEGTSHDGQGQRQSLSTPAAANAGQYGGHQSLAQPFQHFQQASQPMQLAQNQSGASTQAYQSIPDQPLQMHQQQQQQRQQQRPSQLEQQQLQLELMQQLQQLGQQDQLQQFQSSQQLPEQQRQQQQWRQHPRQQQQAWQQPPQQQQQQLQQQPWQQQPQTRPPPAQQQPQQQQQQQWKQQRQQQRLSVQQWQEQRQQRRRSVQQPAFEQPLLAPPASTFRVSEPNGSGSASTFGPNPLSQDIGGRTPTIAQPQLHSTLAPAPSFASNQTPLSSGPSSTASYSSVQSQSFPQNGQPPGPGYVATAPQAQPNGLPASANILTPFSSTASLSGSSPHRTELSQTSSYNSSPHGSAAPLDPSPQISASPYRGSMALSSPFNASLSTSSWSPSGNLATQPQPPQIPQGPTNVHQAQGTNPQQQAYGVFSEQSHKSSPASASSGPYQTKASKATRVQTLAPAAAARVQDIARRCAIAAKATRTTERAASNTSRSTGTGSSGSPGDHRRASVSDASGSASLGPPFSELSPYGSGGSTDMPPPPVPRQGQMGIPSTSFPAQPMNANGKVPMEAQSYATYVPQPPGQFQQTVEPPAQPWSWPPSAPI